VIVIDPGHGGADPGAVAGGVREKDLNLAYGLTLAGELARRGVPVLMTRDADSATTLAERARIANAANARSYVSVHFNASTNPAARGLWLIHAKGAPGGAALAARLERSLFGLVVTDESPFTGGRRLAVLRSTRMPAVLIEYGFLTNGDDRTRLLQAFTMRDLIARTVTGLL
jgi:N-acetylmuramoyl-L-alanine amidase